MQLSTRLKMAGQLYSFCHMDGLTKLYIFKQMLQKRGPIDFSRCVVDLREKHLEYWMPYSDTHPREHNSKRSTYHKWCDLPTKRALVTLRLTIHPSRKHVSLFSNVTLPLIQRHGFKVTPSPMTCEILMISKISFSTASIPT